MVKQHVKIQAGVLSGLAINIYRFNDAIEDKFFLQSLYIWKCSHIPCDKSFSYRTHQIDFATIPGVRPRRRRRKKKLHLYRPAGNLMPEANGVVRTVTTEDVDGIPYPGHRNQRVDCCSGKPAGFFRRLQRNGKIHLPTPHIDIICSIQGDIRCSGTYFLVEFINPYRIVIEGNTAQYRSHVRSLPVSDCMRQVTCTGSMTRAGVVYEKYECGVFKN